MKRKTQRFFKNLMPNYICQKLYNKMVFCIFNFKYFVILLSFCHVHGVIRGELKEKTEEMQRKSEEKSVSKKDIFSLEIVPSLAGNPLHGYHFVFQCNTVKFREYSRPESENVRWNYPMKEPERVEVELSDERCANANISLFIYMTTRNQTQINLWNKQYQVMTTNQRHLSVLFHHYAKLTVSPNLAMSDQFYYVQLHCSNTENDPDLLFHTKFKSETMVVLLDNPKCVVFTAKIWLLWRNQKLDKVKPKVLLKNIAIIGKSNPVLEFNFGTHFLLEISPPLRSSRVYVVYVWCAGQRKSKRTKFVTTIRGEWCTPRKCPLEVLINPKKGPKGSPTPPIYDIAVAEADEDWANNGTESDELPEQLVFHKWHGVRVEKGATFSWEHPQITGRMDERTENNERKMGMRLKWHLQ